MKEKILFFFIIFFLEASIIWGCNDSLMVKNDNKGFPNLAIYAIKGWQLISHNTSLINCQFYPSCSSYAIKSIKEKGTIVGILYSADRISRCHPFAYKYYTREDNKLQNEFKSGSYYNTNKLSCLTIPLSFFVPGFNKMTNGRFYDGITILTIIDISAYSTYKSYNRKSFLVYPIGFIFTSFYISDIFFNILSVRRER